MSNAIIDSIEARMEEKEDRKDKRDHMTVRLAIVAVVLLLAFFIGLTGFSTHQSHMEKMAREERLMDTCVTQQWNPVTCRKMAHWDWWNMDKPEVIRKHKKND